MDREQQEDLPSMSPEKQMQAMGLAPQPEVASGPEGQEEDLPSMPPEKQMEAMGLAPQPEVAPGPEGQEEEARAEASQIEPEMEAYQAERAKAGAPPIPRGGRRQRGG